MDLQIADQVQIHLTNEIELLNILQDILYP